MSMTPAEPAIFRGVIALELRDGAPPLHRALMAPAAGELVAMLGRDLAALVPAVRDCDLALMAGCGAIAALGLTLLNQAYRIAPAPSLAPFEYTALLWGLLWGWLVWGDWPDTPTWIGIALLIGAGLVVLRPDPPPAAPHPAPR